MFEFIYDPNAWMTLCLLIGLELILGIDNILVITIAVSRLPEHQQALARNIGIIGALVMRLIFVGFASWLVSASTPLFEIAFLDNHPVSIKDIVLLVGGAFLLFKAVKEIHHVVEDEHAEATMGGAVKASFMGSIVQIIILDAVFSDDSVITAVGMTEYLFIIYTAVILSFVVVLLFAKPIGDFVNSNVPLKILALSFLVCIGVTLTLEGMHHHVAKAYLYLPMGFALGVELLQMRHSHNKKKHLKEKESKS